MADEQQDQSAAPQERIVPPARVRQAQQRAARAQAGVHLHSRRNPKRMPVEPSE